MKKQICIYITIIVTIVIGYFLFTNMYLNNTQVLKKVAFSYLNKTYSGKFDLVNTNKEGDEYIFLFCTDDDNKIQFRVKCSIECHIFPLRVFSDDLSEEIIKKVISNTEIYDMSDKTIKEITKFIKTKFEIIEYNYTLYDIKWKKPKININIKHNGKVKQILYSNELDSKFNDILTEIFYPL